MNHHDDFYFTPIARIKNAFPTKFGVPRQSGLINSLQSEIIFAPPYRNPDALRGLDGFSHIWLVWVFHQSIRDRHAENRDPDLSGDSRNRGWSPTVRPPRLGGNVRMGVFATRSPFRPNPIGLSCVKLEKIEIRPDTGPVLIISGADLIDNTPILDIKPYLPYADSIPGALGGFASQSPFNHLLQVIIPPELLSRVPVQYQSALRDILSQDPRPRYHDNPDRIYGFSFANLEIKFTVSDDILTVREIINL